MKYARIRKTEKKKIYAHAKRDECAAKEERKTSVKENTARSLNSSSKLTSVFPISFDDDKSI